MKLIESHYDYDYGHDCYLTLGKFRRFNVLDLSLSTSCYWTWEPQIRLTLGALDGNILSLYMSLWSVTFQVYIVPYRSPFDLSNQYEL